MTQKSYHQCEENKQQCDKSCAGAFSEGENGQSLEGGGVQGVKEGTDDRRFSRGVNSVGLVWFFFSYFLLH